MGERQHEVKTPEEMIDIGYGDVKAILPKENPQEAWKKLKAIVDAYIGGK